MSSPPSQAISPRATAVPDSPPPKRPAKSRLRRWLRWVVGLALFLIVLVVLAVVFRNPLLRSVTRYSIEDETGMPVEIEAFELGLGSSSLFISNLTIVNPPEFGDSKFIHIPEIYVKLGPPGEATPGTIAFEEIRFHLASVTVVRNEHGEMNVDILKKTQRSRKKRKNRPSDKIEFGGIQKLTLSLGALNYVDLANPKNNSVIDLKLTNQVFTNIQNEADLNARMLGLFTRVILDRYLNKSRNPKGKFKELILEFFKSDSRERPPAELDPAPM